ncbi:hypothetical protein KKC08_03670 [Patescibacteria group bacterium]|nr:hypothetical protein [Patescibacteria group bacterium]MCG2702041.1 hypothetical protein [Candidatus Parcubacteria bacterium]MBU4265560.1 hypothetical protein [Patescibacteria group bacterium]MBU4389889.1 hypothetical protein [Patescibacteria group bacterium]MBU4397238.1 hypothetical protein [Patescibacteria group bacterium]
MKGGEDENGASEEQSETSEAIWKAQGTPYETTCAEGERKVVRGQRGQKDRPLLKIKKKKGKRKKRKNKKEQEKKRDPSTGSG